MTTLDPEAPFKNPLKSRVLPRAMREPPLLPRLSGPVVPGRALLINPFYPKDPHASFGKHVLTPTLALTSIAAATPPGWRVTYYDENLLQPCEMETGRAWWNWGNSHSEQNSRASTGVPEVVGITVHLTFAERAYQLAAHFRRLGSKVILGGLHALSCPEEVAPHADAIATGDGVQTWPQILEDVRAARLQREYHSDFTRAYSEDPAPAREILQRSGYLTTTSLNATRGCHNRCGFCYLSTRGLRMPYRMRDPGQIAQEIVADGQPYCVFTDNNLGSNHDYLRRLCRALRPLNIIWSAAVTIDVTDDPGLVREMALAGCTGVFVGFESLTDENLIDARKKTPRAEDYLRRVRLLHENGIQVNGSFVLGFDHDRREVFAELAHWVEQARLECATFHILTPYPGTPLFRLMQTEGRLLHQDWSKYDTAHAVFRPKHMTPEELEQGYSWLYQRLFSHESIWQRRPADVRAVPAYLAMCYLYKRSNWLWHQLIQRRLTHRLWSPLVNLTRLRHLGFREKLGKEPMPAPSARRSLSVVSASV